jgi:DNA-binding NtrC family response regulator
MRGAVRLHRYMRLSSGTWNRQLAFLRRRLASGGEMMTWDIALSMKGCRVLIIEDEYFLADDLAKALRLVGCKVIGPVPELSDAMSIETDSFDLAVIDINLRECLAYPIADELKRLGKPFIFVTGYGAGAIPHRFRDVRRFEKPCDFETISAEISMLCGRVLSPW